MSQGQSSEVIEAGARSIGDALCRSAIWSGEHCNWIGHCVEEIDDATHAVTPMVGSLEADLYGGSSGVGMFLARLATLTHHDEHRRTAIGALRRSLRVADRLAPSGFYSGRLGVAHAVALGGAWLGDDELRSAGVELGCTALEATSELPAGQEPIDVIAGLAGAIHAALALSRLPGGEALERGAQELAARLVARAHRGEQGSWSWHEHDGANGHEALPQAPALTGMSHGAAGIGLALLEVWHRSGDPLVLEAARGAFAYEDRLYRADQRNWPDLREWVVQSSGEHSCGMTWCHGAPGIALSRLRALELLPQEQQWRDDAVAAVDVTSEELTRRIHQRGLDATLCHGTCGLAEALLLGARLLERGDLLDQARAVAADLAARVVHEPLVSGVPTGGPNPSLMLGSAGVGWFFLRVLDPERVASFLTSPTTQEGSP
ncbi:MAG: hypothetical protein IAG13_03755 [Deltaproteobacteria bacterium]|nr:hypothetical protein [Nannocystaceae bacterium]